MKENYHYIVDTSVQWFSYLVKTISAPTWNGLISWEVVEAYDIPAGINCPFLSRLYAQELDFHNNYFQGKQVSHQTFYGWDLCCHDFAKVKRLIELFPAYSEFQQLSK